MQVTNAAEALAYAMTWEGRPWADQVTEFTKVMRSLMDQIVVEDGDVSQLLAAFDIMSIVWVTAVRKHNEEL